MVRNHRPVRRKAHSFSIDIDVLRDFKENVTRAKLNMSWQVEWLMKQYNAMKAWEREVIAEALLKRVQSTPVDEAFQVMLVRKDITDKKPVVNTNG